MSLKKRNFTWRGLIVACGMCCLAHADGSGNFSSAGPRPSPGSGPTRALGFYKAAPVIPLAEGFKDPPAIARAQCWWQWPGSAVTREEITRELEEFKAKGLGGVTVKDTTEMPRDGQTAHIKDVTFMSEAWLDLFAHSVAECQRLGLICRSRTSSGWNEGGPWIPPDQSSKVLAFAKSVPLSGPANFAGRIPRDVKGRPTSDQLQAGDGGVLGVKSPGGDVVDLTSQVGEEGRLSWKVPEGSWTLLSYYAKPSGARLMSTSKSGAGLHHDHLSREATDLHLRLFSGRMVDRLGKMKGTFFDGFNSDGFEFGEVTWTPGLRGIFRERCGYDAACWLPVLAGFDRGEKGRRFLYDFQTTVSDLIVENFYARTSAWCRERNMAFEAQGEGGPSHALPMDLLKACGAVDIPMGEVWAHGRSYAKIASSAAHAYGKPLVGLEFATQKPWFFAQTPALLKMRADEAFLLGANYFCLACVDYSPPEAGTPGWTHSQPCRVGLRQTWWPLSRPLFDYVARCSFLLQSGVNVADVAVYNSFLSRKTMRWLAPDDDTLSTHSRHFGFDYVNDDLVSQMRVRDGQLTLSSGATYKVLFISPPVLSSAGLERKAKPFTEARVDMPLESLVKINGLLREGATVVWAGGVPAQGPSLKGYPECDTRYAAVAQELWHHPRLVKLDRDYEANLAAILDKGTEPPAWHFTDKAPLRVVYRRTTEADIFFVVNRGVLDNHRTFTDLLAARNQDTGDVYDLYQDGQTAETPILFRVKNRTPELWSPETGEMAAAQAKATPDGMLVQVPLAPQGSVFVVFRRSSEATGTPAVEVPNKDLAKSTIQPVQGPWEVSFPSGWGTPPTLTWASLSALTTSSNTYVRHFDGMAAYKKTLELTRAPEKGEAVILDLGRVATMCEASLNGQPLGIGWKPPYRFDIARELRPGANELEVRVVNTWHNRLVADAKLPPNERMTRLCPGTQYRRYRDRELIPSGLLGPVRIISASPLFVP